MKIIIAGAHFTPAAAVIQELKKYSDTEIVYVGRKTTREGDPSPSVESQILPEIGIRYVPITTGRLQRVFTVYTIPSLLKIPIGFLQSFLIIFREKPDVTLSFGGYTAVPLVIVSWLFSIPIIIHEQTLVSSLSNTICSFFADKIALTFKKELKNDKEIITGNPLRQEILEPKNKLSTEYRAFFQKSDLPKVLITGGNQGSHIINQTVASMIDILTKFTCVIHQTGDSKFKDYEQLEEKRNSLKNPNRYLVKKWIDASDWGQILQRVDLAVSRAGINTLLELAFFKVPALVIPIPNLYNDEQNKNAQYFEKLGIAKTLPQSRITGKVLIDEIKAVLKDKEFRKKADQAKDVIKDAAKRLALETILLAKSKRI